MLFQQFKPSAFENDRWKSGVVDPSTSAFAKSHVGQNARDDCRDGNPGRFTADDGNSVADLIDLREAEWERGQSWEMARSWFNPTTGQRRRAGNAEGQLCKTDPNSFPRPDVACPRHN
jgi:hypothetical protein